MDAPRFPTWRDLGLPEYLPASIKRLGFGDLLNFLIQDRLFLRENTVVYTYLCTNCGHRKHNLTLFDNYAECSRCGDIFLKAFPNWEITRKNAAPFHHDSLIDLCSIMNGYHSMYSKHDCSDVYEMRLNKNEGFFTARFLGGDVVDAFCPTLATVLAALSCAFIWDARFNFREGNFRDRPTSLHLSHIIYEMVGNGKFTE